MVNSSILISYFQKCYVLNTDEEFIAATKVLWTGPGRQAAQGESEVLSLPDLKPLDCDLPVFPDGDYEAYVARYTSDGVHMCGGITADYYAGNGPTTSCYLLTTTKYQDMPPLLNKRMGAASVETPLGWWVTGIHALIKCIIASLSFFLEFQLS